MPTSIRFLPSIGMTGTFKLKAPFNQLVMENTQYRCTAIEAIDGLLAKDRSPFDEIYAEVGASESDYLADLEAGAYIVTITSGDGDVIEFPHNALTEMPDSSGIVYRSLVLSMSLSAIKDDFPLDVLTTELKNNILARFGIDSEVYITQVGGLTVLTEEQSESVEAARETRITSPDSPLYQQSVTEQQLAVALLKIQELEAHILANP